MTSPAAGKRIAGPKRPVRRSEGSGQGHARLAGGKAHRHGRCSAFRRERKHPPWKGPATMPAAKSAERRTASAARVRELLLEVAFALHATRVVGRRDFPSGVPASENEHP